MKVTNVNTLNRGAASASRTAAPGPGASGPNQKRAIVSLADGDRIEIFGS